MARKRVAPVRETARCRGEGMGYVALGARRPVADMELTARTKDGTPLPSRLIPLETAAERALMAKGAEQAWVAVVPLADTDIVLTLACAGEEPCEISFPARASKLSSRLLTAVNPRCAAALRGIERRSEAQASVEIAECWPAGGSLVSWRVRARFSTDGADGAAYLRAFDGRGQEIDAAVHVLEDHVVRASRSSGRLERLVTFACVMDEYQRSFFVVAGVDADERLRGFDAMNAPRGSGMLAASRARVGGAATDAAYPDWFCRHRASSSELAWQRAAFRAREEAGTASLVSVVMPIFRPDPTYLCEAISSVLAQSWGRLELICVNADANDKATATVLASISDARLRVMAVENRSIAENTNAGIAAATGGYVCFLDHDDTLEPDALFCLMEAVDAMPEADLVYSDEDHLRDGLPSSPALKCAPNWGKLLCHNYVTHLTMVSRRALEATERSGAEVSGAQDYDLILRVFEVARVVVHVPRVLYHWREHEGSTSGGSDQKPYAHEAGRRALTAHLARRGLAGEVEDGPLPCTYHVRFALPKGVPLVSIIIPTRDQAPLLERCVRSITERSTYPNIEVLLVENNSEQAATFELYDELTEADGRVHLCTWPLSQTGAAFNYSALVNFGVSCARGEYVVLLNNDTEVIEPAWIEEMMGQLARPEVGLVGAKLLFADGLVQHVGMVANPDGNLCHVCQNLAADECGAGYANLMPGDVPMVTGACQMLRRSLFLELGGYDEDLAVGFNDGDFCCRVREASMEVTLAERARLYHREFATRGREEADARLRARFVAERGAFCARHSETVAAGLGRNPNCDPFGAYFELGDA